MPYLMEILLPVTETFERGAFERICDELTDRFGGVTVHVNTHAEGLWNDGDDTKRDRIVIVEVMQRS